MSLAQSILNLAPVEARLKDPIRLLLAKRQAQKHAFDLDQFDILSNIFETAGLRPPVATQDPDHLTIFDKIANEALMGSEIKAVDIKDPLRAMDQARQNNMASAHNRVPVSTSDGTLLSVIHGGENTGQRTLFFGAPGTPAELNNGWLKAFAEQGEIITWEMRGLFGEDFQGVENLGLDAQLGDVETVMDFMNWPQSHVMGICGGAVLALAYAAAYPSRVSSLSLWFGDYELGELAPKTDHQHNLKSLMKMVHDGQVAPEDMHNILLSAMNKFSRPDIAPMVLYPFASPALLSQYCRMNYAIMDTDCGPLSENTNIPCSVFYSPHDETTHPEGSKVIAERLGASLEVLDVPGHMDILQGSEKNVAKVIEFQKSASSLDFASSLNFSSAFKGA